MNFMTMTEMYYWDTYFTNVGLLAMGNISQAKNNTDNIRFLINKYGYMPNGNRTFFLGATQPPFYFKMVEEIFEQTGDRIWLSESCAAIAKEYEKILYGYWEAVAAQEGTSYADLFLTEGESAQRNTNTGKLTDHRRTGLIYTEITQVTQAMLSKESITILKAALRVTKPKARKKNPFAPIR